MFRKRTNLINLWRNACKEEPILIWSSASCKPNEKPRFFPCPLGDAAIKFSESNTMGRVIRLFDWIDLKMNMARHLILLSTDYLATSDHHFSLLSPLLFFLSLFLLSLFLFLFPSLVFSFFFFLIFFPPISFSSFHFFCGVSILMVET